jgi:transposase-like protein
MSAALPLDEAKPRLFPIRQRTGTAAFHLSKQAVDFGQEDLTKLTPKAAVKFLAELVWGSTKEMPCPHCGTIDTHYWSSKELRWKCKCCGKRFSVTSQTVFADHKLPLTKILQIAYSWANGASGMPALQLRREWNVTYKTVYTLAQKLREGLTRGFNTGILCGPLEMDGMDVNGRGYKEKRNKPLGGGAAGKAKIPAHLLKPVGGADFVGPPTPPKFGKAAKQHPDRRLMLGLLQRGISKGRGACATRIGIAITESSMSVTALATTHASAESAFITDEDPSYAAFGRLFDNHKTINHSKGYSDGKGVSNNQAESFNWRLKRALKGIYLSASNKYLKDYAVEQAWRSDTRKLSTGDKLKNLFCNVLYVGLSRWWRGYAQGKHRDHEILVDGPRPAKGRGRPKNWKPKPPR